jgi:hypothetical protein
MAILRKLTEKGTSQFSEYLLRLANGANEKPPLELLVGPESSLLIEGAEHIESSKFTTRLEAAQYLHKILVHVPASEIDHNPGLWNWLALYYFDQLCPATPSGTRKPGKTYRYVLPPITSAEHFRHYYRHLLAGPYRVLRLHPAGARALLSNPIAEAGDFNEQVASRLELVTNAAFVGAIDALYFDTDKDKPKRGALNRKKPGTLRRLIDLHGQLDLTYDLYSLSTAQLLDLLPREFGKWRVTTN